MIICTWKQIQLPTLYPFFPFVFLTLRTTSVSAANVADTQGFTFITYIYMVSKSCCPTSGNGSECPDFDINFPQISYLADSWFIADYFF